MQEPQKIKIGNVEIEKTAALAPMASVANSTYRKLCKHFHAAFVTSEMISAKGLCYNDKNTEKLCEISPTEKPMALQLFGDEPACFAQAIGICERYTPSIIDINMGCPVPKIAGGGSGSALMKTPKLAAEIVRAAVKSTALPITVKIRKGWDDENINAVEFAKMLEDAGAAAIVIHGRTRIQMYSGRADWGIIRRVKEAVTIPVIGNGDVECVADVVKMYAETGCDLVMIGRGSYGRPWIFEQVYSYYTTGIIPPEPSFDEQTALLLQHISELVTEKGERIAMRETRKIATWYLKGVPHAASIRNLCGQLETFCELENLVEKVRNGHDNA